MSNTNMHKAKRVKNDEFYTFLTDIEKEIYYYRPQLKNKIIIMPCDDPEHIKVLQHQLIPEKRASQFWVYFHKNFKSLGLKKIIATHYAPNSQAYKIEYVGGDDNNINDFIKTNLKGNGDFRSNEIKEIITQSDIVITNPPFSLFREFVTQIIEEQNKKMLVIGNKNAYTYKNIFTLIMENQIWTGYNNVKQFLNDKNEIKKFGNINWFTNLAVEKRHENIELWKSYNENPTAYPHFDNINAINIDKVNHIPYDYDGFMGVPITFIDKYNPKQFEIIESINRYFVLKGHCTKNKGKFLTKVNGAKKFSRILIRKKEFYDKKYENITIKEKQKIIKLLKQIFHPITIPIFESQINRIYNIILLQKSKEKNKNKLVELIQHEAQHIKKQIKRRSSGFIHIQKNMFLYEIFHVTNFGTKTINNKYFVYFERKKGLIHYWTKINKTKITYLEQKEINKFVKEINYKILEKLKKESPFGFIEVQKGETPIQALNFYANMSPEWDKKRKQFLRKNNITKNVKEQWEMLSDIFGEIS